MTLWSWQRTGRLAALGALLALALSLDGGPIPPPARAGAPEGDDLEETLLEEEPRALTEERAALRMELSGAVRGAARASLPATVARAFEAWAYADGDSNLTGGSLTLAARLPDPDCMPDSLQGPVPAATLLEEPIALMSHARGQAISRPGSRERERDLGAGAPWLRAVPHLERLDLRDACFGKTAVMLLEAYIATGQHCWYLAAERAASALESQAFAGLTSWKTPYPDGTGWAALALVRWGALAHDDSATAVGRALLERMQLRKPPADPTPQTIEARAAAALAVELIEHPAPMAYIIGDRNSKSLAEFHRAALDVRRPERLISLHDRNEPDLHYPPHEGKTVVYVCSGQACAAPVATVKEMVTLLETFARPEPAAAPRDGAAPPR